MEEGTLNVNRLLANCVESSHHFKYQTVRTWNKSGIRLPRAAPGAQMEDLAEQRLIKLTGGATCPRGSFCANQPSAGRFGGARTHHPRATLTDMRGESCREVTSATSRWISYAWPANWALSKSTNCEMKRGAAAWNNFLPLLLQFISSLWLVESGFTEVTHYYWSHLLTLALISLTTWR